MRVDDQLARAADELNEELERVPVPEVPTTRGRWRFTVALAGAIAALVVGGVIWLTRSSDPKPVVPGGSLTATTNGTDRVESPSTSSLSDAAFPGPSGLAEMELVPVAGRVVMFGGYEGRAPVEDQWLFDVQSDRWLSLETAIVPPPRLGHTVEWVDSLGGVVMFGGGSDVHLPVPCLVNWCVPGMLGDMWLLDGDTLEWSPLRPNGGPGPRAGSAMAYDRSADRLVLFGGLGEATSESQQRGVLLADTWIYDPEANSWQKADPSVTPSARAYHEMVYDPVTGRVLLWGGRTDDVLTGDPTVWAFDSQRQDWTPLEVPGGSQPIARWSHTLVYEPVTGLVVLIGGEWFSDGQLVRSNELWIYSPAQHNWTQKGPAGARWVAAGAAGDGNIIAHAGTETGLYSPATDTWRTPNG